MVGHADGIRYAVADNISGTYCIWPVALMAILCVACRSHDRKSYSSQQEELSRLYLTRTSGVHSMQHGWPRWPEHHNDFMHINERCTQDNISSGGSYSNECFTPFVPKSCCRDEPDLQRHDALRVSSNTYSLSHPRCFELGQRRLCQGTRASWMQVHTPCYRPLLCWLPVHRRADVSASLLAALWSCWPWTTAPL
jgi:hypothetical protein